MLMQQLSSDTVVALSMSQLIGSIASLLGLIGAVIAYVRIDERNRARLDRFESENASLLRRANDNEQAIGRLTVQVTRLIDQSEAKQQTINLMVDQVSRLADQVSKLVPGTRARKTPS